jgi:hypothetical protein
MKRSLIYLFILIQFYSFSQTKKTSFDFKKVYDIEMAKEQLKENTNAWMVKTFTNTNNGIKLNSGDNLIARGRFAGVFRDGFGTKRPCKFEYIIEISFKENKYRVTMSDYDINANQDEMQSLASWSLLNNNGNKNDFIKTQKIFYNNIKIFGYKSMIRKLDKPKKVDKEMKRHKKYFDVVEPQIIANQKKISESLFKYLEKDKKSDW